MIKQSSGNSTESLKKSNNAVNALMWISKTLCLLPERRLFRVRID